MELGLELILLILAGILILVYGFWLVKIESRLKRFFAGKKAKDLEDTIFTLQDEIVKLQKSRDEASRELAAVNAKLRKSIRGLETVRFNPYTDQGSNQSFAIGMLNEEGSGVVISSLYYRDRMSVFAKPVKDGRSEFELSAEEREALDKARV